MAISGKPTVISTFCGTGGSSLGYKWAGYKELLAIDFDPHAVECFRANFPEVPCWERSVIDVTAEEIMDFCNIKPGELDVFDGSPPCQGFSTSGKREVNDPRNDLFLAYCKLVKGLQPKVFLMENVSGMVKGKMRGRFIEIMKELKKLNYDVKCKQMNSMHYGVPQSRERLIFIGLRNDINKKIHFPIPKQEKLPLIAQDIAATRSDRRNPWMPIYKGCATITKTMLQKMIKTKTGKYRDMTIDEAKVACSFPLSWILFGSKRQQWARLGNAVMPKFMQAIAETIKEKILND